MYSTPKSKIFQVQSKNFFAFGVDIVLLAIYNNLVLKAQNKKKEGNQVAMLLKAARINAEKTQEETGAHIGKTKATIRSYENYKSKPDVETAKKLAEFYGVSVDDIVWSK